MKKKKKKKEDEEIRQNVKKPVRQETTTGRAFILGRVMSESARWHQSVLDSLTDFFFFFLNLFNFLVIT